MRKFIYLLLTVTTFSLSMQAQERDIRENLYIHVNSQRLISGETLNFSAYCLSDKSQQLSNLSKILYVELYGENGVIFQKKIALEGGRGAGEFFINSLLQTGNYQLVAYTRWMKNFNDYFQLPVTIINPFEPYEPVKQKNQSVFSWADSAQKLIPEVDNLIGYTLGNSNARESQLEARIIDETGETIKRFKPITNGLGFIQFKPELGKNYKVVVADQNNQLEFYPFLEISNTGYMIQVIEKPVSYEIKIVGGVSGHESVNLQMTNMQEIFYNKPVETNTSVYLRKEEIPANELIHLLLKQDETELANSWFFKNENQSAKTFIKQNTYSKRDQANISFELSPGQYSVSVRKKDDAFAKNTPLKAIQSKMWFNLKPGKQIVQTVKNKNLLVAHNLIRPPVILANEVSFLPESRNELLAGKVTSLDGQPASDLSISMASPGNNYFYKANKTQENGNFLFQHKSSNQNATAYIIPFDSSNQYNISLENKFLDTPPAFDYTLPQLDTNQIADIVTKSKRIQIENAFLTNALDSLGSTGKVNQNNELLTAFDFEYNLSDYTQFKKLSEYFLEIIIGANVRKGQINITNINSQSSFNGEQLILLDGIPVDRSKILTINPLKIETIKIANRKIYLGNHIYDGLMILETLDKNLMEFQPGFHANAPFMFELKPIENQSNLSFINLTDPIALPLPDQREQLYWDPLVAHEGGSLDLSFITSDVSGTYHIVIEGYSKEGKPVSSVRSIIVE